MNWSSINISKQNNCIFEHYKSDCNGLSWQKASLNALKYKVLFIKGNQEKHFPADQENMP